MKTPILQVMCRYRSVWNVDVRLRPVLLAGIMKGSGNQPPALIPKKGIWMGRDLKLLAKHFQVPVHEPKDFFDVVLNKGSLSAMRFVTAVGLEKPEFVEPVSRELWMRIWSRDEDITKPESILLAAQKAGLSSAQAQTLLEKTGTAAVKDQLKYSTDEALNYGAFGMPTIVAHIDGKPRMFFGSDRFELLAYVLGEKWLGPVPPGQKSLL